SSAHRHLHSFPTRRSSDLSFCGVPPAKERSNRPLPAGLASASAACAKADKPTINANIVACISRFIFFICLNFLFRVRFAVLITLYARECLFPRNLCRCIRQESQKAHSESARAAILKELKDTA